MAAAKDRSWRIVDLAHELGLSISEASMGLERSKRSGLLDGSKKKIVWQALLEFILHGLKHVYPAAPGPLCRSVPTAHSAPPLYDSVPHAASKDPELYQLLALIDALRVGRAREREIAGEGLRKRLSAA